MRSPAPSILLLAYLAFVSLGLPDAVIGVAWPSLRESFDLPQAFLGLPIAMTAAAYFLSGMLAGRLMQRLGIGSLLAGSTALVAVGLFGYTAAPVFLLVLPAAAVVGFGSGAIDAALNTYAARCFRPRHVSWLHAAYAAGATAGPAILTAVLGFGASWRVGYGIIGLLLAALVPPFVATRRRWGSPEHLHLRSGAESPPVEERVGALDAIRSPRVRLQIVLFFLYSGIEVTAGQWSYTILTEARDVPETAAGTWVSAYWGGLLAGRIVLGWAIDWIGQVRLVRLAMVGAVIAAALFATPAAAGAAALPLLSFSLASIYPGLMAETPRRVGAGIAPHAVGFQVSAATLGIAVVPNLAGLVGEQMGLEAIGGVVVVGVLVLLVGHEALVAIADRRPA